MKISVTLHSKQFNNGDNIVMVRVYDNGKYTHYSTGVGCKKANWNGNTNRVSSKDRAYQEKNNTIEKVLAEVTGKHTNNTITTNDTRNKTISVYEIVEKKIATLATHNAGKNYQQLANFLKKHYPSLPISEITQTWFDGFFQLLLEEKQGAQREKLVTYFKMVMTFAEEEGYTNKVHFKYDAKQLKRYVKKEKYIDIAEVTAVVNAYKKDVDSNAVATKVGRKKDITGTALFALHLAFNGIMPVDMANIKVGDIVVKEYNTIPLDAQQYNNDTAYRQWYDSNNDTKQVLSLSLNRSKTAVQVDIHTMYSTIVPILDVLREGKSDNDYLINCLDANKNYTSKQVASRITNYYTKMTQRLFEEMQAYYNAVGKECTSKFTFSDARHAFATILFFQGVNTNIVQRMMGHKDSTLLRHYISPLSPIQQAEIVGSIFDSNSGDVPSVQQLYAKWQKR